MNVIRGDLEDCRWEDTVVYHNNLVKVDQFAVPALNGDHNLIDTIRHQEFLSNAESARSSNKELILSNLSNMTE